MKILRNIAEKDSDKAKSWKIMSESYWDLSHWADFDKDTNSVLKRIDINFAKTEKRGGWSDLGASVGRMAARLKVIKHGDYYDVRLLGFDRSNYEYKEDATDIKDKWIRWANNFFYDLQQQGLITPFSFEVTSNFYFNKSNGKVYTKW